MSQRERGVQGQGFLAGELLWCGLGQVGTRPGYGLRLREGRCQPDALRSAGGDAQTGRPGDLLQSGLRDAADGLAGGLLDPQRGSAGERGYVPVAGVGVDRGWREVSPGHQAGFFTAEEGRDGLRLVHGPQCVADDVQAVRAKESHTPTTARNVAVRGCLRATGPVRAQGWCTP